jgi:predicted permease
MEVLSPSRARRWFRTAGLVLRDAWRAVRRAPAHAAMVIGVLAIGITAGAVTFSVVDAVLLKPLPIEDGERVVFLSTYDVPARKQRINGDLFWQLHDHTQTLESVSAFSTQMGQSSTIADLTDEFPITRMMADGFRILHLSAGMGRLWTTEEETRGETDVAVLGYRFWKRNLGGRSDVLDLTVRTGTRSARVIGVLGAATDHPEVAIMSSPIWMPTWVPRTQAPNYISIIAKVRADQTRSVVADELRALAGAPEWTPTVSGPLDAERERVSRWMLLSLGASGLLVLLGCMNAANLMLSRSVRRARELAVRVSLGASTRQIGATVVAEGLIFSLAGTAVALLLGLWGVNLARQTFATIPLGISQAAGIVLNGRVMAAAIVSAIVTGVLFSLVPAWQASRVSVVTSLKDGASGGSGERSRWRRAFLAIEVATVTVLLVVAWMFVTSLVRVVNVDLGVDRSRLIGLTPRVAYGSTVDDVADRLRRVPGVADVAVSTGASLPLFGLMSGAWVTTNVSAPGGALESPLEVLEHRVTPNFFGIAGVPFRQGAVWSEGAANPIVLDDIVARRLFGDENPMGRQVLADEPAGIHTVVGVVPSLREKGPEKDQQLAVYFPLKPNPARAFAHLLVRTTGPADGVVPRVTEALAPVAPGQKDPYIHSGEEAVRRITMLRRFNANLSAIFGLVGLLIGAAGVYAVTSSVVSQQTREIGLRMALGATPQRVAREVITSALSNIGFGLVMGLPLAWWLSRGFGSLLFDVTPAEFSVYVGVSLVICAVGVAAALLPSRRASRVDPIISLRS